MIEAQYMYNDFPESIAALNITKMQEPYSNDIVSVSLLWMALFSWIELK